MKRAVILSVIIIVAVVVCCAFLLVHDKTDMRFVEAGEAVFRHGDADICMTLSSQDQSLIVDLFENKVLYKDDPSCGFTEDVSVQFNKTEIFCIANDTCPIIYWKNKDRYFRISESEYSMLVDILEKYGFYFPCI